MRVALSFFASRRELGRQKFGSEVVGVSLSEIHWEHTRLRFSELLQVFRLQTLQPKALQCRALPFTPWRVNIAIALSVCKLSFEVLNLRVLIHSKFEFPTGRVQMTEPVTNSRLLLRASLRESLIDEIHTNDRRDTQA